MTAVIDVQNMHKSYGGTAAVDDVSFGEHWSSARCVPRPVPGRVLHPGRPVLAQHGGRPRPDRPMAG
jgi:hypothetical protein